MSKPVMTTEMAFSMAKQSLLMSGWKQVGDKWQLNDGEPVDIMVALTVERDRRREMLR